jgi:Tfp pilus assembly protein PilN
MLLLAFSLAALLLMFSKLNENRRLNEIAERDLTEMKAQLAELNAVGEKVQSQLTPAQRELLVASHKLVANKTFSWSRLFYDLESVLPGSVSASRISVENVFRDGDRVKAELDLTVRSAQYPAVMDMISRMNNTGVFLAELRAQNRQETDRMTYTEYTLRLVYTPPFGVNPDAAPADVAQNAQGGAE